MKRNLLTVILLSAILCLNWNTVMAQCGGTTEGPVNTTFCQGVSVADDIVAQTIPTSEETGFENYTFVITSTDVVDADGNALIVDLSDTGAYDFTDSIPGMYGFTGFGYNQSQIDAVATFLNANPLLAGVIGLPEEALPLPEPLPLIDLLNIAKGLVDALTIPSVEGALGLLGPLGLTVDFCLVNSTTDPLYTITVTDDASQCAAPVDCSITSGGMPVGSGLETFCLDANMPEDLTAMTIPTSEETNATDYTFVVTSDNILDVDGSPAIVGLTDDGAFDFTSQATATGTYQFTGFAYNQEQIDAVAEFLNANPALAAIVGIPPEALPVPVPLALAELLDIARGVVGDTITIPSVLTALGAVEAILPSDLCYAVAAEETVSVVEVVESCGPVAPDNNDCSGASFLFLPGPDEAATYGPYDNTEATNGDSDPALPGCFPDASLDNTLWYSFMGDGNTYHIYTTRTCLGFDLTDEEYIDFGDTQLAVYTGDCGDLAFASTLISTDACNEDDSTAPGYETGNYVAGIVLATEMGVSYSLMIDGYLDGETPSLGQYCIQMEPVTLEECTANIELVADQTLEYSLCPTDVLGGVVLVDEATLDFGYDSNTLPTQQVRYAYTAVDPEGANPLNLGSDYLGTATGNAIPAGGCDGTDGFGLGFSELWVTPITGGRDADDNIVISNTCLDWASESVHVVFEVCGEGECVEPNCDNSFIELGTEQATTIDLCPGDSTELLLNLETINYGDYVTEFSSPVWVVSNVEPGDTYPPDLSNAEVEGLFAGDTLSVNHNPDVSTLYYTPVTYAVVNFDNSQFVSDPCQATGPTITVNFLTSEDAICQVATCTAVAGTIELAGGGDAITTCAGDGNPDPVDVTVSGNAGENSAWVITDADLNILGLPEGFPFDFEGAGAGICLVWHVSWDGDLMGAEVGANAGDLAGDCFVLSNSIEVTRQESGVDCNLPTADCPELGLNFGDACDDGNADTENDVVQADCTCAGDPIPPMFDCPDISANIGDACDDGDATTENDAVQADCTCAGVPIPPTFDCPDISANIGDACDDGDATTENDAVQADCTCAGAPIPPECTATAGTISTNSNTTICGGDGIPDAVVVTLNGGSGQNSAWVLTTNDLAILNVSAEPNFDFESAPPGVCLIWHLYWDGDLTGAEPGNNAADLVGNCYFLSNSIAVTRLQSGVDCNLVDCPNLGLNIGDACDDGDATTENDAVQANCTCQGSPIPPQCTANGGVISTNSNLTVCVGDGIPDPVAITVSGQSGDNNYGFVITDEDGSIINDNLLTDFEIDFEQATGGLCIVYGISFDGTLTGFVMGANIGGLGGCFNLSNSIAVTRLQSGVECNLFDCPNLGANIGDACDDGNPNTQNDAVQANCVCVGVPIFDCPNISANIGDACDDGNPNTENDAVQANCVCQGSPIGTVVTSSSIALTGGASSTTICAGDGIADPISVDVTNLGNGTTQWVITDDALNILALPAGPPFDLEGAGAGTCLIWLVNYDGALGGVEVGGNAGNITGNFALSNQIDVVRVPAISVMLNEVCNAQSGTYIVQVNITGGTGNYTVSGDVSTTDANFDIGPKSDGESYTILVEDGLCQSFAFQSGPIICTKGGEDCTNSAGAINLPGGGGSLEVNIGCGDGDLNVSASGVSVSNGSILVYVLKDGNGNVVAVSSDGNFSSNLFAEGESYTVNTEVGVDSDGDGRPDADDECYEESPSVPIAVVDDSPEISVMVISGGGPFKCTAVLTVSGGTGPYTVVGTNGTYSGNMSEGNPVTFDFEELPIDEDGAVTFTITVTDANGCTVTQTYIYDAETCMILPIELGYFEGEVIVEGNLLKWMTLSEIDNATFLVERSLDGTNFETIATLEGAGTSFVPISYQYLDKTAPAGESYYRLTQVDFNGDSSTSNTIVLVRGEIEFGINTVNPIPVVDVINVNFTIPTNTEININLYDLTGRLVQNARVAAQTGLNSWTTDMSNFSSGVYFLSIDNGTESHTAKIIKK